MRLRREGHHRRRAGGDPAQWSCRLGGLLPRVRRNSVRDSSRTDGPLSQRAEAACGVAAQHPILGGEAATCPGRRPAIAQPARPPALLRRQWRTCLLEATGRASVPRGLTVPVSSTISQTHAGCTQKNGQCRGDRSGQGRVQGRVGADSRRTRARALQSRGSSITRADELHPEELDRPMIVGLGHRGLRTGNSIR